MKSKITLSSSWAWICAKAYAVANPVIESLTHAKPLPAWTNKHLAQFCLGVWAFAVSLNWFADSKTFVIIALSLLALKIFNIVIKPEFHTNE